MASRAVSLFLEDDVSFLSDNSLPPHIHLLKVRTMHGVWVHVGLVILGPQRVYTEGWPV